MFGGFVKVFESGKRCSKDIRYGEVLRGKSPSLPPPLFFLFPSTNVLGRTEVELG